MGFKSDESYNFFLSDPEELFQIGLRSSTGHDPSFQAQAVAAETYRPKYLQVVLNKCCNLKLSEFSETKPTCWPIFCEKIFFFRVRFCMEVGDYQYLPVQNILDSSHGFSERTRCASAGTKILASHYKSEITGFHLSDNNF